jgi:hypothetical protein
MTHLAWLLITQASPPAQEVHEAIALATRACQASGFRQALALRTLAAAYAVAGQPEAAARTAQQALAAAHASANNRLVTQLRDELSRFHLVPPQQPSSEEYVWPYY